MAVSCETEKHYERRKTGEYFPPPIWQIINNCPFCKVRLSKWRDVKHPDRSFRYFLCRTCGYVVVREKDVNSGAPRINTRAGNTKQYLARCIFGSRKAGVNFEKPESVDKFITVDNMRYITREEEDAMCKKFDDDNAVVKETVAVLETAINVSSEEMEKRRGLEEANRKLREARAARAAKEMAAKESESKIPECRFCGKRNFATKQDKNNHACVGGRRYLDVFAEHEKAMLIRAEHDAKMKKLDDDAKALLRKP